MNHRATKKLSAKLMAEQNSKPKSIDAAKILGVDVAKKSAKDKSAVSVLQKENEVLKVVGGVDSADQFKKDLKKIAKKYTKVIERVRPLYIKPASAPSFNHF